MEVLIAIIAVNLQNNVSLIHIYTGRQKKNRGTARKAEKFVKIIAVGLQGNVFSDSYYTGRQKNI